MTSDAEEAKSGATEGLATGRHTAAEELRETGRVEAFSDAVFAIAATLLVLELKVPKVEESADPAALTAAILDQWPMYVSFLIGFGAILLMWLNHHELFTHIVRVDRAFILLNGLLLVTVTIMPFPTALVAEYIGHPQQTPAVVTYIALNTVMAIAFNLAWRYAVHHGRLLSSRADAVAVAAISRDYLVGPIVFLAATLLAVLNVEVGLAICVALGIFFALPRSLLNRLLHRQPENAS